MEKEEVEIWKDIPSYEGRYMISSLGRVKSLERVVMRNDGSPLPLKERILKPAPDGNSYLTINLHKDGKQKNITIHQIVAIAFLDHTPNGHKIVVDHINNVKTDNRLKNLQIISQRENSTKDKTVGTSQYVGVHWFKRDKKWQANIRINGKQKYLGLFTTELKAHEAYQKTLKELEE